MKLSWNLPLLFSLKIHKKWKAKIKSSLRNYLSTIINSEAYFCPQFTSQAIGGGGLEHCQMVHQ
jgi:hypothetical protein